MLNAQRLVGLTVGKTYMMTPTKSVTAVIGLTTGEISTKRKGCMSCNLKGTCRFRESEDIAMDNKLKELLKRD